MVHAALEFDNAKRDDKSAHRCFSSRLGAFLISAERSQSIQVCGRTTSLGRPCPRRGSRCVPLRLPRMTLDLRTCSGDCCHSSIPRVLASRPVLRRCQQPQILRRPPVQPFDWSHTTARPRRPLLRLAAATSEAEAEAPEDFEADFALMQSAAQGLQIDPERPKYHVLASEGGWLNVSGKLGHPTSSFAAPPPGQSCDRFAACNACGRS